MSRNALIAFYSRSGWNFMDGTVQFLTIGNTRRAADVLRKIVDADVFEIRLVHPYSENYYECIDQARQDMYRKRRPEIESFTGDIKAYDIIYLGYPNYWGTMPMPVVTFLEQQDLSGKVICPFCTHGGDGLGHSESDIKKLLPDSIVLPGLAIYGDHASHEWMSIEEWVQETNDKTENQKRMNQSGGQHLEKEQSVDENDYSRSAECVTA